jgi:hypothetical protein
LKVCPWTEICVHGQKFVSMDRNFVSMDRPLSTGPARPEARPSTMI